MQKQKETIPPQISDESVAAKTGRNWEQWFDLLDKQEAHKLTHQQIVAIAKEHGAGPWWQQMVTVTYEKARGLRKMHEKADGFQVSASKTMSLPVEALYHAWQDESQRKQWLGTQNLQIRTANENKSLRIILPEDDSRLDVEFYPKAGNKTQVTVQHSKIPDGGLAAERKVGWKEALTKLNTYLNTNTG